MARHLIDWLCAGFDWLFVPGAGGFADRGSSIPSQPPEGEPVQGETRGVLPIARVRK